MCRWALKNLCCALDKHLLAIICLYPFRSAARTIAVVAGGFHLLFLLALLPIAVELALEDRPLY